MTKYENLEYELKEPTLTVENSKGEPFFYLKAKTNEVTGELYFIFDLKKEKIEKQDSFEKAWNKILETFKQFNVPLYNAREIIDKIMKTLENEEISEELISIKVKNYVTGKEDILMVVIRKGEQNE